MSNDGTKWNRCVLLEIQMLMGTCKIKIKV
jgi:hypothetical protein